MLLKYVMSCIIDFSQTFRMVHVMFLFRMNSRRFSRCFFANIYAWFRSCFCNYFSRVHISFREHYARLHAFSHKFCESTFSRIFGRLLNVWPSCEFRSCSPVHISDILKRDNFTLPCGIPVFFKTRVQVSLICSGSG